MDASGTGAPAAGWYGDPANSANARWWDGTRWTDQVRFATPELHYAPPIVVPEAVIHQDEPTYVPFQREREIAAAAPRRGISYTRAGWWLSAQPIWTAAPLGAFIAIVTAFPVSPLIAVSGASGLGAVAYLVSLALAVADSRGLVRGGNGDSASALWALASPFVYLVARGRAVARWDDSPWGALIWWIVALVVSPGFALVAFFGILGIVP